MIDNYENTVIEEVLGSTKCDKLDLFDKFQLTEVLKLCKTSKNISDAGRKLFAVSRKKKQALNDSDRLKKYLAKFGILWTDI